MATPRITRPRKRRNDWVDISGQRFGRLVVESRTKKCGHDWYWVCRCDCGLAVSALSGNLRSGRQKSCGCLQREQTKTRSTIHGATVNRTWTREYSSWQNAKRRCFDPRRETFPHYGGRGITMCDEWRKSFAAFLRDMGPCPAGHSIDRIDHDGHYEPTNCRWATQVEQSNNTRSNVTFACDGGVYTAGQLARMHRVPRVALWKRLTAGQSVDEAVAAIRRHRSTFPEKVPEAT